MELLRIYNTVDSTNAEAQRLLAQGPVQNGMTLLAREQTSGKGQFGRTWLTQPGNHLAMSIILVPHGLDVSELPLVSMKTCLGIAKALKHLDPRIHPEIKWPNDIYLQGKKLCGILIENAIAGSKVQHIIIGIGMNVNERAFPIEIPHATSIYISTGLGHELYEVAQLVRHHVIDTVDTPDLYWKSEYDQLLFGLNKTHAFDLREEKINGILEGVDEDGKIILHVDGKTASYFSHEIKWIIG